MRQGYRCNICNIVRAYLRDSRLLILDEPTALLDKRTEHEVFSRFAELTAG
jgi:ABC-type multidrug transport system fused ATPase/permease subunit